MTIGESPIRVGSIEKVLGTAVFGADLGEKGDLFLVCVRTDRAPSKIETIDTSEAERVAGVVRIFTAKDIPGEKRLGIIAVTKDQEFLAEEYIRHTGQAVALVAAETEAAARKAAALVKLAFKPLDGVFDPVEALKEGAPPVHPETTSNNLQSRRTVIKGDAEKALARSEIIHEATYGTSFIEHAALEPEGGRAWIEDGRLIVQASTQNTHYDQKEIARFLGIDPERVRVIQAETGGAFGGKLDMSVQPYLGLAAWFLQRPVRMTYAREETFAGTGKRHPIRMHYVTGVDRDGRLTGMKVDIIGDTGAFASYGLAVTARSAVHATGPYYVPNLYVESRLAYTNNPWAGAMRGFGVPQVALAHEGQMDALADKLGMDRIDFRLLNALGPGLDTATGQVLTHSVGIVQCLEKIKPIYQRWKSQIDTNGDSLEGVGVGAMFYGIGNTGMANPSTAQLEWTPEGRIVLYTGAAEIGQGSDTVLRQLAARRLQVPVDRIELVRADTDRTTDAGASSASRQTYISGNAVVNAAAELEDRILVQAETVLGIERVHLEIAQGEVRVTDGPGRKLPVEEIVRSLKDAGRIARSEGRYDPVTTPMDKETCQGSPYGTYAFAAQAAWVRVDPDSGEIRVKKVAAAHDVGKAVHRKGVEGQICGGVVMGMGMAVMEEFVPGVNDNFENYHIPTITDMPDIETIVVEDPEESGPYGAKGVGEPAVIPTSPAVAAAVGQAVGRPMRHLPISLERVMDALTGESRED